jgi:uncharacterized Zn finger protein
MTRTLQAYCEACQETQPHEVDADPGRCRCTVCGQEQQMYSPLDAV